VAYATRVRHNKGVVKPIRTERLLLRNWSEADREPFAAMNADPAVMEHFSSTLSREESDAMFQRLLDHISKHDFGPWVVEIPHITEFAGFVGLGVPAFDWPFGPAVEVAWRLIPKYWGKGYATEAAGASLQYGFSELGLDEVVAFTTTSNLRSVAVMKRLGMEFAGNFQHPNLDPADPLRTHVVYRIKRPF
jgi:ribosomal-protein-alanine N-acetyltransferase